MCGPCAARWESVVLDGSWRAHATLPARGLPALQCRLVCDAGGSGVGRDGREVCKFSSVQFSSVQFSSVQRTHAAVVPLVCVDAIACTHARMHWLATGLHCAMMRGCTPARTTRHSRRLSQPLRL